MKKSKKSDEYKVASYSLANLLETMDRSHEGFVNVLKTSPSANIRSLLGQYNENYTNTLQRIGLPTNMEVQESGKNLNLNNELD